MSKINTIPEYKDFKEFYTQGVLPYKAQNPTHIRLDGKILGSSRNVSAYFWYLNKKWKINAETYIDRMKLAFEACEKGDEPFVIKFTRDKVGEYLVIKGHPLRNNKFNVFRVV